MGKEGFLVPENSRWIRRSYGSVSIAINKSDGRIFAVKSVEKASSSPAQLDALENEIAILRSLSSPFIVKYYGDDVTKDPLSGAVYRNLHMEYVPGGTAATGGGAQVDEETVRAHTWCVVSALKYMHSKGIVHCDVKGRNILAGSTPGIAKLADFGTAKREILGWTGKIVPRGTPLWMAPEVVRGESQGFESDVWSLGCTVIEMVTGKPAWRDEGVNSLSRIGYSDELPQLPSQLSELGRDFLEKCLRRDPSQRWSCDQLLMHPFLRFSSANKIAESSPRSVIDWSNLGDHDDSDHSEDEDEEILPNLGEGEIPAPEMVERVGKLATERGANWESDGWMVVRSLASEGDGGATSDACSSGSRAGTGSEHLCVFWGEEGVRGTILEDQSSTSINSGIHDNLGGCGGRRGGCKGVSSCDCCRLRLEKSSSAVGLSREKEAFTVTESAELLLIFTLLLLYSTNLRHNNNNKIQLFVSYISWFYFVLDFETSPFRLPSLFNLGRIWIILTIIF
ncbi:hypothetical protein Ancab_011404 [Ancistrocladus abbreviatus]